MENAICPCCCQLEEWEVDKAPLSPWEGWVVFVESWTQRGDSTRRISCPHPRMTLHTSSGSISVQQRMLIYSTLRWCFLNVCCSVERQQAMQLLGQALRSALSAACQARHSEGEVSLHCPSNSLVYLLVKNYNSTTSCSSHSKDATHIFIMSLLYFTRLPTKWSLWSPLPTPHTVIYVSPH